VGMRMMMESQLKKCQTEGARLHTMVQVGFSLPAT
jgi:hypothetical protein